MLILAQLRLSLAASRTSSRVEKQLLLQASVVTASLVVCGSSKLRNSFSQVVRFNGIIDFLFTKSIIETKVGKTRSLDEELV